MWCGEARRTAGRWPCQAHGRLSVDSDGRTRSSIMLALREVPASYSSGSRLLDIVSRAPGATKHRICHQKFTAVPGERARLPAAQ